MMEKHFVEFYSPGTIISETNLIEINSWDVNKAIELSKNIVQRHNSKPYGFKFITKSRNEYDLDSKITKQSNFYYLGGKIKTLAELKAENNPKDKILIDNMECNGYNKIIENNNSYKFTNYLNDDDIILNI
jgi:hypothetical protein